MSKRNLETFFGMVDQDGNREIEQAEATKFLRELKVQITDESEMETKEDMSELMASSQFDFNFSYGGNSISAEEMLNHLSNMMTANHVVDWVTHGLELPQYAEAFRQNAINGMDFPALIENDSEALIEDLGIKSSLHRKKVTHALVRQIFGIGTAPGSVRSLQCNPASCGGIQLSWEAPGNSGVPPLHKYLIERWSQTFSTWTNVADTREVNFMDINALKLDKDYTYRVQTWGSHGPSDWVTVYGCRADFILSPFELDLGDILPSQTARGARSIMDQAFSTSGELKPSQEEESERWTWITSAIILVLALISRHTFFFDVTLAAWVLLKNNMSQSLRQGLDSPYYFVRAAARSMALACRIWNYTQYKAKRLARFEVDSSIASRRATVYEKSLSEPCMRTPFEIEDFSEEYFETHDFRSLSANNFVEASGLGLQMNGVDSSGSSLNTSARETEFEYEADTAVVFPPLIPQEQELHSFPIKRSKNRCNHEGCKIRFDRWHALQDWWMKLNKHYCRECQSVYCVKHTRISPHGPRGQCGLDSSCYCYSCFARLPLKSKRRLEELNKLRVGPSVSSDSSSSLKSYTFSSSKQRGVSPSSGSLASSALSNSFTDTVELNADGNRLIDLRDTVEANYVDTSE
ncbi:uncharacterized protein [Physcomitrium patens]|uniref:uncharacterized protein isoform X2 n=1 Tax=Physcomitrium patens TaxID=3218 RepID=UPI000D16D4C0|nr:uncharacterized protein LOC112281924 isoform X2 [Physcomitrium patens]|eukprot:XP_024374731.1 uncharacterized protein LOC112281924 isoform X2 [Physcomitrella patens]